MPIEFILEEEGAKTKSNPVYVGDLFLELFIASSIRSSSYRIEQIVAE